MHTAIAQSQARSHSHHQAGHRALATDPSASATKPKLYNPRHPERTLLYETVAEHFETWHALASAGQFDGQGDHQTPRAYVRQAFRKYLECGIFAHGFARSRCDDCGHDYFVAYSCKGRGVCPSCNTRRMVETAAHLTDHVFPTWCCASLCASLRKACNPTAPVRRIWTRPPCTSAQSLSSTDSAPA